MDDFRLATWPQQRIKVNRAAIRRDDARPAARITSRRFLSVTLLAHDRSPVEYAAGGVTSAYHGNRAGHSALVPALHAAANA
jgi:hypothetical protein